MGTDASCPVIRPWIRYMATVKSLRSRLPRCWVSARFLAKESILSRPQIRGCAIPAHHICESVFHGNFDFMKTSRAC